MLKAMKSRMIRSAGMGRELVRKSLGQVRPVDRITDYLLLGVRRGVAENRAALNEIEGECANVPRVAGVWHAPELDRIVVRVEPEADFEAVGRALIARLGELEKAHGFPGGRFHTRSRCPDFQAQQVRLYLEMAIDLAGFGSGLLMRKVDDRTFRFFSDVSALGILVEYTPGMRAPLDEWIGRENGELLLRNLGTLGDSFSQGWSGSLVDLVKRTMQWRAETAREICWHKIAQQVLQQVEQRGQDRAVSRKRSRPLPNGAIETYRETGEKLALAAFSASMAVTHDLSCSAATLFSSIPRPALLGRDAFRLALIRELAKDDILVLNPESLNLLDRVTRIVVDGRFANASRVVVTTRYPNPSQNIDLNMLNTLVQNTGASHDLKVIAPRHIKDIPARIRRWWESTNQPLEQLRLVRKGRGVCDAVLVDEVTDRTIESLLTRARQAGINLHITDADCDNYERRVRRLQKRGHTVMAVGASDMLRSADIAVGVVDANVALGTGAGLLTARPLDTLWRLITAIEQAQAMAEQSVQLAKIDAFSGLILALEPLERRIIRRVRLAANIAGLASLVNGYRLGRGLSGLPIQLIDDPTPWHAMDLDTVREQLALIEPDKALAGKSGARTVPSLPALWLEEMKSPLVPVLMTGTGLAALTGSIGDALLITTVLAVDGLVGGMQRHKTEQQLQSLGMDRQETITVLRKGETLTVDLNELVPGDEISLRASDLVPADARLIESEHLETDESSLTGESLPVEKSPRPAYSLNLADRHSMLWEGTAVVQGEGRALVVKERPRSEARRGSVVSSRQTSGVAARLERLTELTVPVAGFSGVALLLAGLSRGRPVREVVGSGVSLAVAAVPEGLPILATMSQLAAAGRLSERGALARNPRSVEALGRMTVLCADKTGTLTEGTLAVQQVALDGKAWPVGEMSEEAREVLALSWMASTQDNESGEELVHVTDQAIGAAVMQHAEALAEAIYTWRRVKEMPFKSERGYHAVLFQSDRRKRLCVKGAPETIIEHCNRWQRPDGQVVALDDKGRARLIERSHELAGQGLRVLAVAERPARSLTLNREKISRLIFRGFIALADPVRSSAKAALGELLQAGVKAKMITGDHPATAQAIAQELEIDDEYEVLTGAELDEMSDYELSESVDRVAVFARVTPAQKARIVKALQARGEVVGMTGDGANDASAIRLADVGVALGRDCSPPAQQAADLLVADGRIETIVAAVLEGRALWSAVRDAVSLLVGGNLGEIGFTLVAGLFEGRSPLNARQLLLINLLTDTLPALAIVLRKPSSLQAEQLLSEGPESSLGDALTREIEWRAALTGGVTTAVWTLDRMLRGPERSSTVAMLTLIGGQLMQTLMAGRGSRDVFLSSIGAMAVLGLVAEFPPLGRLFGCTRPGLVGWTLVGGSLAFSAAGARYLPWIEELSGRITEQWGQRINHWLTDDALESERISKALTRDSSLADGLPELEDASLPDFSESGANQV